MGRRVALAALAVAGGLLLSSCIGIESHVSFNRDGSGVLKIEYRIAKSLADLGKEGASQVPLPVNEEELRQALSDVKGLKLVRIGRREDDKDIFIAAEIGFERIEAVGEVEAFADMPMSLERSGDDFVFRQRISGAGSGGSPEPAEASAKAGEAPPAQSAEAPASADALASDKELTAMFAGLFEGYELVFVVSAPRPIKSSSAGELSADRRSVTYRLPLDRMMQLSGETTLAVTW